MPARSLRGKGTFGTELARFQPFDSVARGGVSVAAAQIDGTNADDIIVGSGPGIPSEVKVYQIPLAVILQRRANALRRRSNRTVTISPV